MIKVSVCRNGHPIMICPESCAASADTHPKDGDVKQAPLVSGAVGSEASETPTPGPTIDQDGGERTEAEELAIIAAAFPPKPKCDADGKFRPGETLKEYFERNGTPVDPNVMEEYERATREDVIPQIERDLKAQERAAHFLRLGIPDPNEPPAQPEVNQS